MVNGKRLIINTDGGARGNPGPAGIGIVIQDEDGNILKEHGEYIGKTTNNQAEYQAVVKAFDVVRAYEITNNISIDEIDFYIDSELVVKQLKGEYKVKNEDLGVHVIRIHNAKQAYKHVTFTHVPREKNKEADKLVNESIDKHSKLL